MAKYKITTDKGSYMVTTEDGAAQPAAAGFGERLRSETESFLKTPALPIIAGTGAGLAASSASPLVSAPAAALAGGAGEAIRQIGLRAVSSKQKNFLDQGNPDLPQTSGAAAKLIAERGLEQGAAELGGRALGAVAKPVLGVVGKGAAAGMKGLTKIPAANFEKIFANPSELFTAPLKSTISKAYGKVGFFAKETIDDAVRGATASDASLIKTAMKEIEKPFNEASPSVLLDARKAVDAISDQIKFFGGPKQARSAVTSRGVRLGKVREYLQYALDTLAGLGNKDAIALRQADALASKGAAANSFRSLVPRVNVMQSLPRTLTAPLVVPAVAGGLTAAAGAAYKGVPVAARAAMSSGTVLLNALRKNKK